MVLVAPGYGAAQGVAYCNNHAKEGLDDVRFTTSDGVSEIPYYIERWDEGNNYYVVWVKVPSILTVDTTIFMYYGKNDALPYSSGDDTFGFFDDFDGETVDILKWDTDTSGGTLTISNSWLYINNTTGGTVSITSKNPCFTAKGYMVEWKVNREAEPYRNRFDIGPADMFDYGDFNPRGLYWNGWSYQHLENNVDYVFQLIDTDSIYGWHILDIDYNAVTGWDTSPKTCTRKWSHRNTENAASDCKIDWVRTRKYYTGSLTWGLWSEEQTKE